MKDVYNWRKTWKQARNVSHYLSPSRPSLIYLDLDVLVHNSGNNWGAPFEEYVPVPVPLKHSYHLTCVARRSMVQSPRIEPPKTIHTDPKTAPLTSQIPVSQNNPHRLDFRNRSPGTRDICLFRVEGRVTSFIAGACGETWTARGES